MRTVTALTGFLFIAALSAAAAQTYPDEDVTVNPEAAGTQVLLYPGEKYGRAVYPLRMPGTAWRPIKLRMPARHRLTRHASSVAAAAPAAQEPVARPALRTRVARIEQAPVAPPAAAPARPDFGKLDLPTAPKPVSVKPAKPERKPQRVANIEPPAPRVANIEPPAPRVANIEPPAPRVANIEPPVARPAKTRASSGSPREAILFAPNASDPSSSAVDTIKSLASALNAALVVGDSRVQLMAYGGQRGVKSSDTRRLSLKRALVIRQLLIDDGVPSERIDVRAMGGVDDNGPADRVDVFVKS